LAEQHSITLAQLGAAPATRMPDGPVSLASILLDEISEDLFIMQFSDTGGTDAVWNA